MCQAILEKLEAKTLRTSFCEHRCAVVAKHLNCGSYCAYEKDMKIRALCPISGNNDSRVKGMK